MSDEEKPKRAARPRGLSDVIREARRVVESAGFDLQELAESVVASASEIAEVAQDTAKQGGEQLRQAATRASSQVRIAVDRASTNAKEISAQVLHVVRMLDEAAERAESREEIVERFIEAGPLVASQLDARAPAIAIGTLGESGVGVQDVDGVELRYVRGDTPALVVTKISGRGARLAAGVSRMVYAGCLYGDREVLAAPLSRRGADVGVAIAGFRFFRASTDDGRAAGGWWVAMMAGLNLGIPILSELGAFELKDQSPFAHPLTSEHVERIERALAEAPDRGWRRAMAESLAE